MAKRTELKKVISSMTASDEEKWDATIAMQKLPKNSCPTRIRNRCALSGRPRGNYSDFMLSRIAFRSLAHRGMLPGVTKASW